MQKIVPHLWFDKPARLNDVSRSGRKAKMAMAFYVSLFPDSKIEMIMPYGKDQGDMEGFIKHARFTLGKQHFMAMDSSLQHDFIQTIPRNRAAGYCLNKK